MFMLSTACQRLTVTALARHERQLRGLQLGIQLGELLQTLQVEIVRNSRVVASSSGRPATSLVADAAHPATLLEGVDDLARHRHPADGFYLRPGDGLTIGNQRQRLHHGAGITGSRSAPQARQLLGILLAGLETPAGGHLFELDPRSL